MTKLRHPALFCALAVGLLVGCTENDSPAQPAELDASFGHGVDRSAAVNQGLASLRATLAPFHRIEAAVDADYATPLTPCWYYTGQGGMGYHYGNPALIDGTVDLLAPETLIYEPQPGGSLHLVGLEYLVPTAAWAGAQPPSLLGVPFHDNGAGLWILHVWAWKHNPAGMFEDWNPRVTCDYAEASEDRAP